MMQMGVLSMHNMKQFSLKFIENDAEYQVYNIDAKCLE